MGESPGEGSVTDWVLRALHDGAWVLDDAGVTTYANETFARMVALPVDTLPGAAAADLCDAESADRLTSWLRALVADDVLAEEELEVTLVARDGAERMTVLRPAPLLDDAGVRRGWLMRVNLPTRRRLLFAELRERERELAEAQAIGRIGSWDWTAEARATTWSAELYRICDVAPGTFEPSAERFFAMLEEDDQQAAVDAFARLMRDQVPMEVEARLARRDDGPERWVRVRGVATYDATGAPATMRGTVQDITESKNAELALGFLSAMAQTANEARTLEEALLASVEHVRPYSQLPALVVAAPVAAGGEDLVFHDATWFRLGAEERAVAEQIGRRAVAERRIVHGRSARGTTLVAGAVHVDGRLACVVVSDTGEGSEPRESHLRLFGQTLTLLGHVAEREWAAAELAAARDDALAASRAKSEFLATMSHEIRTPLNGVIGLSELLSRTQLDAHQLRLARGVDQAGRTLLSLVNDILDLSKVEAGRLDLEQVDFDPAAVVEQSAALLGEAAADKGLELVVSCAVDLPRLVCGDPVRFGQVITNLAANAVKFTAVGEVHIRASGDGGPDGPQVRVEVRDTGVGVAPEVHDKIFRPFSQADSSTTREYGGTGLGLAISQRIVGALGGEIGLESVPGAGATFWFTAAFAAPENDAPDTGVRERAVAGLRILVVDDNETNRFILTEQLEAWGVQVRAVDSAYDALAELDTAATSGAPYDLMVLDYMMPGTDGEQLARMVRSEERHDSLRMVLLSSAADPTQAWLSDAGIDESLGKPVLPSRLLDTLAGLAGRLPVAERELAAVIEEQVHRGRVLVVEDNQVNQLVAEGVLRQLGYDVFLVEHGAHAVAAMADDPAGFDAVLMDCQMPVMDGFDATRAIRAMPGAASRVPIVAMTAAAVADERDHCLAAGMDEFLSKPVDVAALEQVLDRLVRAQAPPA